MYLDETVQNPNASSFWRDETERKEKYLNFTHRGLAYQIVVNHNQLEGKGSPIYEKHRLKPVMLQAKPTKL